MRSLVKITQTVHVSSQMLLLRLVPCAGEKSTNMQANGRLIAPQHLVPGGGGGRPHHAYPPVRRARKNKPAYEWIRELSHETRLALITYLDFDVDHLCDEHGEVPVEDLIAFLRSQKDNRLSDAKYRTSLPQFCMLVAFEGLRWHSSMGGKGGINYTNRKDVIARRPKSEREVLEIHLEHAVLSKEVTRADLANEHTLTVKMMLNEMKTRGWGRETITKAVKNLCRVVLPRDTTDGKVRLCLRPEYSYKPGGRP